MSVPILYQWDGEAMRPLRRFAKACDQQFGVGEVVPLVVQEARSRATHSHYFACIQDAWDNLPEEMADNFASPEHLRKWALIRAGYRDERTHPCASKAEAMRFRAFIRPMDEFAVVLVREAVVVVYTAQSQSMKAMGRKTFAESKQAVLGVLADMIGTTPEALAATQRAA